MTKAWHISDVHLSMDSNWRPIKPMHLRKWALGVWTYIGYLEKMVNFSATNIADDDFVFITGDMVHDMKERDVANSFRWLRHNIKGIIVICRGNHDKYWDVGRMRQICGQFANFYILDEGEILTIGPYTIGCYSNHSVKTQDFSNTDGRYLEMAMNIVRQAKLKDKIPVMISHYPVNLAAAQAIGNTGLVAYMSGHIHCTDANNPTSGNGINLDWYNQSAIHTDDKVVNGCFYSTGTTDVVLVKHGQSFKEMKVLEIVPPIKKEPKPKTEKAAPITPYKKDPEVVVLCGLPGSGKSTIAKILQNKYGYVRVNQDDLGGRDACIAATEAALKAGKGVVIDRCNADVSQRKYWVDIAKEHGVNATAVVVSLKKDIAMDRVLKRKDHPTIKTPEDADKAMFHMNRMWTPPTHEEGFKFLEKVDTEDTSANLLADIVAGVVT